MRAILAEDVAAQVLQLDALPEARPVCPAPAKRY